MTAAVTACASRRSRLGEINCAVCAQSFLPTRADASTCSPACRQKLYRARRRGGRTTAELLARIEILQDAAALESLLADCEQKGLVDRLPGGLWALTRETHERFGDAFRCLSPDGWA